MQHLLRAISGPQAGAVYVLGRRTILGRANNCDVQLLHPGVSRQHARITQQPDGSMVISDLSSDNGTYLEGERVTAHRLISGQQLRVLNSQFIYEVLDDESAVTSDVFRHKVTSGDSLRRTLDHRDALQSFRASMDAAEAESAASRERPYSRPQAAAPAPSGARPGTMTGAGSSRVAAQTRQVPLPEQKTLVGDSSGSSTSLPALGLFDGSEQEHGPVDVGGTADPPRSGHRNPEDAPEFGQSLIRPFARASAEDAASTYGWHSRTGQRRRDRVEPMGPSLASAAITGPPSAPPEAAPPDGSGSEPGEQSDRPAVASPSSSGAGWTRVAPPVRTTPGSMRPGSTLSGIARVDDDGPAHSSGSGSGSGPGSGSGRPATGARSGSPMAAGSMRPEDGGRQYSTAEYGAAGGMPRPTGVARPAPESTLPGVRRAAPGEGAKRGRWGGEDAAESVAPPRMAGLLGDDSDADDLPPLEDEATHGREIRGPQRRPTSEETQRFRRTGTYGLVVDGAESHHGSEPVDASSTDPHGYQGALPYAGESVPRGAAFESYGDDDPDGAAVEDTLRFRRKDSDETDTELATEPSGLVSGSTTGEDDPRVRELLEVAAAPNQLGPIDPSAFDDAGEGTAPFIERDPAAEGTSVPVSVDIEALDFDDADDGPDTLTRQRAVTDDKGVVPGAIDSDTLSADDRAALADQERSEQAERERLRRAGLDAVVDILQYRALRLRSLRGDAMEGAEAEHFAQLTKGLQHEPGSSENQSSMRRYHRFECLVPAQLGFSRDGQREVAEIELADVSAGGAKITFGDGSLGVGDAVQLALELDPQDRSRLPDPEAAVVVQTARVVWARPLEAEIGLIFAGAPRYVRDLGSAH